MIARGFEWSIIETHDPAGEGLRIDIELPSDEVLKGAMVQQAVTLVEALKVYAERNVIYRDNWKRMGLRGQLIRIRERAERLWDGCWEGGPLPGTARSDDALDLINFAAFAIRALRGETTHGGEWWPES